MLYSANRRAVYLRGWFYLIGARVETRVIPGVIKNSALAREEAACDKPIPFTFINQEFADKLKPSLCNRQFEVVRGPRSVKRGPLCLC